MPSFIRVRTSSRQKDRSRQSYFEKKRDERERRQFQSARKRGLIGTRIVRCKGISRTEKRLFDLRSVLDARNDPEWRLKILRRWSNSRIHRRFIPLCGESLRMAREEFDRISNELMPDVRKRICYCCQRSRAAHRHHIVQLQNGGPNIALNLVPLCESCHEAVHPWMKDRGGSADARTRDQGPRNTSPTVSLPTLSPSKSMDSRRDKIESTLCDPQRSGQTAVEAPEEASEGSFARTTAGS